MSRKNKFFISVSPLGLLALSACGGGSTTGTSTPSTPSTPGPVTYNPTSGKAQSGPLNKATVFLDYNQDGVWQATDSAKTLTDVDGKWSITPTQGTYNIVVTTSNDDFGEIQTTDSTIGGVVSKLTLVAPSGADNDFNGANVMVTPATTMISNLMALDATLTASAAKDNVAKALGFTQAEIDAGFDPLTFDAFDPNQAGTAAYDDLALKAEKTSKKVMTVVNAFAAAVEGSATSAGAVSTQDAFTAAFGSVTKVLGDKIANMSVAGKTDADKVLNFDLADDLSVMTAQLASDISNVSGASKVAFDDRSAVIEASIANVVKAIDDISDINDTQSSFQTIGLVSAQIKSAVQGAQENLTDAGLYLGQDADGISKAAEVAKDAALVIEGGSVTNAVAQRVTITSSGDDTAVSFYISGTDAAGVGKTEILIGAKAGVAVSIGSFLTITDITADGDPAGTVAAGVFGVLSIVETDDDGISMAGAVANNAPLDLNGVLVDSVIGTVTNLAAVKVTIKSSGDDSGVKFTVVGTNAADAVQSEVVNGANIGTATTLGLYKTIDSIVANGDPVGTVAAGIVGNSKDVSVTLSDAETFASTKNNPAPTDIFGSSSYLETSSSSSVGNLQTVDANQATGHTYKLLTGLDYASFTLTAAGALSFGTTAVPHQPDFETKSSYSINVQTTDALGKTYVEEFTVTITDDNEKPVITAVGGAAAEDAGSYTIEGTLSAVDPEGQAITYGADSLNGSYGGTLEIEASTGKYTYTMNNDNGLVQDLQSGQTLTETFTVLASDGGAQGSASLSFTISGADDVYLTPPLSTDADGISKAAAVANNGALLIDGALALSGSVTNSVAQKVTITSAGDDAADADCIAEAQSVTGNTALVINGAMSSGASVTHTVAEKVTITSVGNDSSITFTVVGTDADGAVLSEEITGANAGVATGSDLFLKISSITASASTDGNVTAGSPAITFKIVGTNAASEAVEEIVTGTNAGTATSVNSFLTVASITAAGDPAGNVTAGVLGHVMTQGDASTITGTLSGSDPADPAGAALNYSIAGSSLEGGSYTYTGKYGTLSVTAAGGDYEYVLDNDDADTKGIAKDAVLTETFTVAVDTAAGRSTKELKIEITGINDAPVITAPTGGAVSDGATVEVTDKLVAADPDTGSAGAVFAITGGATSGSNSNLKQTYGTLSLDVSDGSYTYKLDSNDPDTRALTSADTKTETFTVTATDANGAVGEGTLSFAVSGAGITVNPIAGDNKVNAAEATGFNITGRGTADATVTLTFNSGLPAKTATVNADGDWSVAIVSADIIADSTDADSEMDQLGETVTATIGSQTSTQAFVVDTVVPTSTISGVKYDAVNDADGISLEETVAENAPLVLGGVMVESGSVTNSVAQKVTIASVGNDSLIKFTVVGTDAAGAVLEEDVAGANAGTATSINSFKTVASITAVGAPTGKVSAGTEVKQLVLSGLKFDEIASTGTEVKSHLNWGKLVWDINGDGATTDGVTFALADIASAIVTSATVLTIQLTGTKAASLQGTAGFAAAGATDNVDIAVGFSADAAGNAATSPAVEHIPTYSDASSPKVTSFSAVEASGSYGLGATINITATLSEVVMAGSGITVTLNDTASTPVKLTTVGNSDTLTGVYTVPPNATQPDLSVAGFAVTSTTVFDATLGTTVSDPYGNKLVSQVIGDVSGKNLADNRDISIDTSPPTNTITEVSYNSTDKTILLGGATMTTIEDAGVELKDALDWTKLKWNLDADNATYKTFSLSEISSAKVTSSTLMTITLTAEAAAALEATTGFAADGLLAANAPDTIDVLAGFSRDLALNPATTDAAADLSPNYSDVAKPVVTSFTSSKANGSYKAGDTVEITAHMSEVVLGGSSISVTLNSTSAPVFLSTTGNSNTLVGTYTVQASDEAGDLSVKSFAAGSAGVIDLYNNTMSSTDLPTAIAADPDGISLAAAVADNGTLVLGGALAQGDADGISAAAHVAKDAALQIKGALAAGDSVTNATAQKVTISSVGDDSLISFKVVGTDASGAALEEDVSGANAGMATSAKAFKTIASITAAGDPDGNVSAGTEVLVVNAVAQKVTILSAGNDTAIHFTVAGTDADGAAVTEQVKGAGTGTATSQGLFKTITSITAVGDPADNVTAGTASNAQNLADNKDIVIDTSAPTSTISSISYGQNASGDTEIIFGGDKFNLLAAVGTDVRDSLDWTKVVWDLDGDGAATDGVTFKASDFTSAKVTSAKLLTATLTDAKVTSLEATNGFAQDGLGATAVADNVDVAVGFIVDLAGNVATTDVATDTVPTYTDATAPTVTKFDSNKANGSYGADDVINITAHTSEAVIKGGQISVTLDGVSGVVDGASGSTVTLTAAENGKTLTGDYVVAAGQNSTDLTVASFAVKTAITDLFGNALTSVTLPASQNLGDNAAIVIDTAGPSNTIATAAWDSAADTLTLGGAGFTTIAATGTDVKSSLDWSKLVWDINGDGATTANKTFSVGEVTSALITSPSVLTITLTSDGATSLKSTAGFAASGAADNIDVTAGFSTDAGGNAATTDGQANMTPSYSDNVKPTISSFTSTTPNAGYGKSKDDINITATASEEVLAGSNIVVTLDNDKTVTLTAATNGTSLVGVYDPKDSTDNSLDLTVASFVAGNKGVIDIYGQVMNVFTLPAGVANLGGSSAIIIDASPPASTITAAAYDNATGTITLTGTKITDLGNANSDVKENLDWTKLVWDLDADGSNTPGVGFELADITSAKVTNATTLTIDLEAAKQSSMEATAGFGAANIAASGLLSDNIDVSAGFTRDAAKNPSAVDAKSNMAPTYADATNPSVVEFTSTTENGSYKNGDAVIIQAVMNEVVLAGSKLTVTLDTPDPATSGNDRVTLTTGQNSNTLTGTYTISSTDTSADLSISSYSLKDAAGATNTIIDLFGNAMSTTPLPAGENLSDNKDFVIDNTALFLSGVAIDAKSAHAAGDSFAVEFSEAVGNTAALTKVVTDDDTYGTTDATTAWTNSNKTMTVTLGAGETLNADIDLIFASVLDLAGNEATNITYNLDIV